ncbi:outer membrane lipoprotein carrier protein LolA [Vibrio vulnificus]|uniref:outer membrane lipoprotein carrier protein LolA n=1 Tax=Vibrio vulnificus TaxID=672 RepID=UPI0032ECD0E5
MASKRSVPMLMSWRQHTLTLWLLVCTLFSPLSWAQVNNLDELQAQLSKHDLVRGQFTQQRHLEMFNQPLSSQGQFVLDKSHGLLWQQQTPFPVNLVLTQDKLRQSFAGQAPQVITAEQNPMAFYFSRIFLSVFHGDTSALQRQFELTLHVDDNGWQLDLTPTAAPLNAVFSKITLRGNEEIDQLELVEKRGDRTDIQFSQQTHTPKQLSETEQKQFAF